MSILEEGVAQEAVVGPVSSEELPKCVVVVSSSGESSKVLQKKQGSVTADLTVLSSETLVKTVQEMEVKTHRLVVENKIFLQFLEKNDPECLEDMQSTLRPLKSILRGARRPSITSASMLQESLQKINAHQKVDMVVKAKEVIRGEVISIKENLTKVRFELSARLEESQERQEEIRRVTAEFEAFHNLEQINLDKFVHFMNECSRKSNIIIGKLRLRHSSLKVQYQKLTTVLAHKRIIGENLTEIDFEHMKIENVHLGKKIDMQSCLLMELKKMTGKGNLQMSKHKFRLQDKVNEKETLIETIQYIEDDIIRCDDAFEKHNEELSQAKSEYDKMKLVISTYKAPSVFEYIQAKARLCNLQRELKKWTRRKQLKEITLNLAILAMQRQLKCSQPHPAWFL